MAATYLPTLKQLQYLVALRDHGHFGRAAEACFVTQSTLSAGLRELETLIGLVLVERTRRVVRFTPLGERIADKARRVLREAEELGDLARAAGRPLSGVMRMSVIPTIAPFMLPHILPRLRADYPDLQLYLREEPSAAACEALNNGRADCVLLALPYGCGEVTAAELFEDRLFLAGPPGELPDDAEVSPDAINPERLLLLEDGHCLRDHALAACARPELRAEATMLGTSLHTIVQMVDNGLGVTMLPEMAVKAGILDHTGIEARPLASPDAVRRIALVWRRASPREADFRLLADTLAKAR
ncbi:hydrogen peroxide-inducible genes activator [Sphingomonas aerophila]|jgi:LysR family hydrogen peroxide-inducible transcriptional activator|uniref:LysR family hydrogen peroxide-inducible transcriptional activator n=1 Tax=Sphingomonas aerophila TaxID=1344948 RepID=A0A7W9EV65_9SPHN|nr:hydrogen peroxide-inducible genes activator [Sphingomonas aerophila]MBB5714412.1 LysR family hydrogen peroxide-inducible transcriptional activator [Sphingomonas aerophila]